MIPWLVILLICSYFALKLLYKPKREHLLKSNSILDYDKFGKMSNEERATAAILFFTIILWILEIKLNINASITALLAAFLCFLFKILDTKELSTAVPWDMVIYLGGVLNLGNVFAMVGLDTWLQNIVSPFFENINNIYLIITLIIAAVLLVRLILVSQNATIVIMLTVLSPVLKPFGMSPFIVGMIIYTVQPCWFLPYQNVIFSAGLNLAGMNNIDYNKTMKACFAYEIINFIAIFASIPYWRLLGYM